MSGERPGHDDECPDASDRNGWKQVMAAATQRGMKASDYDLELEDLNRRATGRLIQTEIFDYAAFLALRDHLSRRAEAIKDEHVISKQVLSSLRGAAHAIRNQAPHVPAARENLALADEFEMMLDLMAIGEDGSDRVPGVPRIV